MRILRTALVVFLFVPSLYGATYVVPPDAELIREAHAIAILTIQSSHSYFAPDGSIQTDYEAIVESPLKGAPATGSRIVVTQRGGSVGDLALVVSGEPAFLAGERALLMMRRVAVGRFTTLSAELGKFSFVRDARSRELLIRGASEGEIFGWDLAGRPHTERPRKADAFLRYIEAIAAGESAGADYEVEEGQAPSYPITINSHVPGNDYTTRVTIGGTTQGGRWPGGNLPMKTVGTQAAVTNLPASINTARGAWNGDPNSSINITNVGTGAGTYGTNDRENLIFFDQPNSGPLSGSVVGQANFWMNSVQNTNGSDTYFTSTDCDIIIEVGFSGGLFEAILGHEMGHCIGFRHSNQPGSGQTTSSSNALMNSSAPSGATLRAWDSDAASHVYGSGGTSCSPPSISTHPQSKSIGAGSTTTLSVVAGGTGPLTYQWYVGNSGNTASPTGTNSSTLSGLSPSSTTAYWVRVTGQCVPPADSNTATITVEACVPASINTQPSSKSITAGASTSLNVGASGSGPFTYQWYIGNSGNTSTPTGSNSSTLSGLSPLSTTSYWVRVTGLCGPPVDSNTATITVTSCANVIIQSATATTGTGGSVTLAASAIGGSGITYTWFRGDTPGVGGTQIGTGTPLLTTITGTTNFWVRARNSCGNSAVSNLLTAALCGLPSIATQPADQTINSGASATLTIALAAPGSTVRWFRGAPPDKTQEVGTGETISVGPVLATATFWAAVTNSCGEVSSRVVTITIAACIAPSITTQPQATTTIKAGESVTLTVAATGTATLTYAWFRGEPGDTSSPVGTNSPELTSGKLLQETKFWVRVTNGCGVANSNSAVVKIPLGRRRSVRR